MGKGPTGLKGKDWKRDGKKNSKKNWEKKKRGAK